MLTVKIISPENILFDGQVVSVCLPGSVFPFEVLNDHAPIIATLSEGRILVKKTDGSAEEFSVKSGIVKVENNIVSACVEL